MDVYSDGQQSLQDGEESWKQTPVNKQHLGYTCSPYEVLSGDWGGGEPKMRSEAEIRVREGRGQKRERDFFF